MKGRVCVSLQKPKIMRLDHYLPNEQERPKLAPIAVICPCSQNQFKLRLSNLIDMISRTENRRRQVGNLSPALVQPWLQTQQ